MRSWGRSILAVLLILGLLGPAAPAPARAATPRCPFPAQALTSTSLFSLHSILRSSPGLRRWIVLSAVWETFYATAVPYDTHGHLLSKVPFYLAPLVFRSTSGLYMAAGFSLTYYWTSTIFASPPVGFCAGIVMGALMIPVARHAQASSQRFTFDTVALGTAFFPSCDGALNWILQSLPLHERIHDFFQNYRGNYIIGWTLPPTAGLMRWILHAVNPNFYRLGGPSTGALDRRTPATEYHIPFHTLLSPMKDAWVSLANFLVPSAVDVLIGTLLVRLGWRHRNRVIGRLAAVAGVVQFMWKIDEVIHNTYGLLQWTVPANYYYDYSRAMMLMISLLHRLHPGYLPALDPDQPTGRMIQSMIHSVPHTDQLLFYRLAVYLTFGTGILGGILIDKALIKSARGIRALRRYRLALVGHPLYHFMVHPWRLAQSPEDLLQRYRIVMRPGGKLERLEIKTLLAVSVFSTVVYAGMSVLWVYDPSLLERLYIDGLKIAGACLGTMVALYRWAGRSRKERMPLLGEPPNEPLITTGPYRFMRHPTYMGHVLFFTAIFGLALPIFPALFFQLWRIYTYSLKEDLLLLQRDGEAFIRYAERTPRFFNPWFYMQRRLMTTA